MKNMDFAFYKNAFTHLRRDQKMGGAPHKPILLLSLLDVFEKGLVDNNRIFITPELIGFFKANWSEFVKSEHEARFALPFFHMRSEPFWKLVPNDGCEIWVESKAAMRSLGNLQTAVRHAEIAPELFELLKQKEFREAFRQVLIKEYFPNFASKSSGNEGLKLVQTIENQLEKSSPEEYVRQLRELKSKIQPGEFEEEVAFRGTIFKRQIPRLYGYTCCISGLKVDVSFNSTTLIEACHIKPFSVSYDDTLSNGLALCPTLHDAFDAGLFTILEDFSIGVSPKIKESDSPQSIGRFDGQKIRLPETRQHFPNIESLQWHRQNVFEKGR